MCVCVCVCVCFCGNHLIAIDVMTFQLMNDFFGYHDELLTSNMFDISASRIQSLTRFQVTAVAW